MNIINNLRKRALVICLSSFFSLQAQTVNTEWATKVNAMFANVDKTKVPHSLLLDYAMEFADLSVYNGTLTDTSYVTKGVLRSIYKTLVMARVNTSVPDLINPSLFNQNWDNLREKNVIVLSGLYYKYSRFKSKAHPNYITISNNKLYDKYVNGVWQNPYEEKQVFAVATPITKFKGLDVSVKLPQSLWYTNQSSAVQSVAIDFGNGSGYVNIPFNTSYQLQYTQEGVYDWKYKLTLTSGQILYSHSKIFMLETAQRIPWNYSQQ